MSATNQPGTLAIATVRGVPNVRVFRLREGTWVSAEPAGVHSTRVHHDEEVTDVRSLVALDLGHSKPEVVVNVLRRAVFYRLAEQIEAQTRPPKPAEPTGLGAVVEDAEGVQYIRIQTDYSHPWVRRGVITDDAIYAWHEIDAVRVLSEGVTQ